MYIRRKAYSVAIDENGEEKLFSTTEIMSEEAYVEKLYAEAEKEEKKSSVGKKVAIGAGATAGTAAAAGGTIYGAKKLGDYIVKKAVKDLINDKNLSDEQYRKRVKVGVALQEPEKKVEEVSKKVTKKAKDVSKEAGKKTEELTRKLKDSKAVREIVKKVARKGK